MTPIRDNGHGYVQDVRGQANVIIPVTGSIGACPCSLLVRMYIEPPAESPRSLLPTKGKKEHTVDGSAMIVRRRRSTNMHLSHVCILTRPGKPRTTDLHTRIHIY